MTTALIPFAALQTNVCAATSILSITTLPSSFPSMLPSRYVHSTLSIKEIFVALNHFSSVTCLHILVFLLLLKLSCYCFMHTPSIASTPPRFRIPLSIFICFFGWFGMLFHYNKLLDFCEKHHRLVKSFCKRRYKPALNLPAYRSTFILLYWPRMDPVVAGTGATELFVLLGPIQPGASFSLENIPLASGIRLVSL